MDPATLSIIGLTGNILQFIDWLSSVLAIGNQIRRNGTSDFNLTLEQAAEGLERQVQRIMPREGVHTCHTYAENVS